MADIPEDPAPPDGPPAVDPPADDAGPVVEPQPPDVAEKPPLSDEAILVARKERAEKGHPRKVDITPAVKLDFARLQPAITGQIDEYLADRDAAGLDAPDRQEMLDRAEHLLAQVDPTRLVGINSLGRNRRLTIHHKDTAPFFLMGTEGDT